MSQLQDDWQDIRCVRPSDPSKDHARQEPLTEDWDEFRYPDLPRLPRLAYRVVGESFETAALQQVELLGRLDEPGGRKRSRLGYVRFKVVDTLWVGTRYDNRRDIGQTICGSLDHIDLTLEDALETFRSDVAKWKAVTETWRQRALVDIEERKSWLVRYEAELNAMQELDGISQGILNFYKSQTSGLISDVSDS